MWKQSVLVCAAIAMGAGALHAADSGGPANQTVTEIEATVVDVACVLNKDCPPNCGDGKRQLGLLTSDGKLRLAAKGQSVFAGAVHELLPHCGKVVFADGLLIQDPALTIFMVQNLRLTKADKLQPATAFDVDWTKQNGQATEWFRADPRVKKVIEDDGVFGIKGLKPAPKP
jgi:hypothetical protein